ncbi:nucleoside-diphosphate-sugar epimerase [Apiospora kogelbergensis]|uniref:Nucleoside-diphosphate-sugar epimerase n=1 Tax=Apiospora kogelbergensis TaxID=1337665 RepID=A0AAW0Q7J1_9PEZI
MAVKIFLTGATGYIGGDALSVLSQAHPEFEFSLLIRTQEKADKVKAQYPDADIVLGDLDDSELLREQAAKADIVLHTADASDHEAAARAIAAGLAEGHSGSRPGFWLHTGGTGILTYRDSEAGRLGEHDDKEFADDDAGVAELTSLPDGAFHRNVDKVVLEAGASNAIRTAIVCPPTIYGTGRGPVATRGRQAYELARLVLRGGYAPVVGAGRARWNHVHVADLSEAFRLLVEQAVVSLGGGGGEDARELWGARGYYLVESGEHVWGELARAMAAEAFDMGLLPARPEDRRLDKDQALAVAGFEAVSWGWNSRGGARCGCGRGLGGDRGPRRSRRRSRRFSSMRSGACRNVNYV